MSVNEDWDVEQHKVEYESDEHWELRRKFLLSHKDKFSEDVLVCLAQVFVNVELLGCRYPQETMDLVKELSKDIAANYREKQKKKLQRTFVEASQAASSKVKGCKAKTSSVTTRSMKNKSVPSMSNHVSNTNNLTDQFHDNHHVKKSKKPEAQEPCILFTNGEKESMPNVISNESCNSPDVQERLTKNLKPEVYESENLRKKKIKYGNFILWERQDDTIINILDYSATLCGRKLKWNYTEDENEEWLCTLNLDSEVVCSSRNKKKSAARDTTIVVAYEILRKRCYTVKVKYDYAMKLNLKEEIKLKNSNNKLEKSKLNNSVPNNEWRGSNSIGEKLMKMMGWTGGGLGKSEQGVVEPISIDKAQVNRSGLGHKPIEPKPIKHDVCGKAREMFQELVKSAQHVKNNIVFLNYIKKDKKKIINVARFMGLKLHWHCDNRKGNRKKIIASRKVVNVWNFVEKLDNFGGISEEYELVKPSEVKNLFHVSFKNMRTQIDV